MQTASKMHAPRKKEESNLLVKAGWVGGPCRSGTAVAPPAELVPAPAFAHGRGKPGVLMSRP